jgi:DNA invertase Pin-like site-specific DNA recombinase
MKAVGYIRVSTDEQAEGGVSLEAQEQALRAYAAMRGLELVEVVADPGVSAGKPLAERKGGKHVLRVVARRQVGAVLAWKLDRVFRDAGDCLAVTRAWDRQGVALHLVDLGGQAVDTSSAMGRFFLTVLAGAAEMERNLIRERTSAAMRHMRAQGRYTGGKPPFGFALAPSGELVEEPAEQAAMHLARKLREGGLSLRAVGDHLTAQGHHPRSGGIWHASMVRSMLRQVAA